MVHQEFVVGALITQSPQLFGFFSGNRRETRKNNKTSGDATMQRRSSMRGMQHGNHGISQSLKTKPFVAGTERRPISDARKYVWTNWGYGVATSKGLRSQIPGERFVSISLQSIIASLEPHHSCQDIALIERRLPRAAARGASAGSHDRRSRHPPHIIRAG